MKSRKCGACEEPFAPRRANQLFCSKSCTKHSSRATTQGQKFQAETCMQRWCRRQRSFPYFCLKHQALRKKRFDEGDKRRQCLHCGTQYTAFRPDSASCSLKCQIRLGNAKKEPRDPTEGLCRWCGIPFVGRKGRLYCSVECNKKYQYQARLSREVVGECQWHVPCDGGDWQTGLCRRHYLRKYHYKTTYKASYEELLAIGDQQGWACPICCFQSDAGGPDRRELVLDHDHATGEVRGWLTDGCNQGIGSLKDDPLNCVRAALYLTKDSADARIGVAVETMRLVKASLRRSDHRRLVQQVLAAVVG